MTNPNAEVASPEARLEALFSGKQPEAQEAKPEPDQEQDDEPDEEPSDEGETETEGVSDDQPEEEKEPEPETVEVEIDGETYAVPKKLEASFLKQKDYTQKTQEVAAKRKELEERAEQLQQLEQARGAVFEKAVELRALEARLEQFKAVDWQSLPTDEAFRLDRAFRDLQEQHRQAKAEIGGIVEQTQQMTAKQKAAAVEKANQELARDIKGWGRDLGEKVIFENGRAYGFSDAELSEILDPRYVKVMHDAWQWKQLQASKEKLKTTAKEVKPVTVKAARSAQTNQVAQQTEAARARLKKTHSPKDAEEALFRIFDRNRKR